MKTLKEHLYFLKIWTKAIFLYPQEHIQDTVDYEIYWDSRKNTMGGLNSWQEKRASIVSDLIRSAEKPVSIVDIGCGDGAIINYLKKKNNIRKAVGVDVSQKILEVAKQFDIETFQIDFRDIKNLKDIPGADFVLLLEVLEHLPNSEELLRFCFDKANNGVFFSFPNSGYFLFRLRLLFGKFPLQWGVHPGEHLRFWTNRDVKWWLKALGYKDYTIFCYEGIPVLNKIFPSLFSAGILVFVKNIERTFIWLRDGLKKRYQKLRKRSVKLPFCGSMQIYTNQQSIV